MPDVTDLLGQPSGPPGLLPIPQQAPPTTFPSLGDPTLSMPMYSPDAPPPPEAAGVTAPPSFLQNIGTWFKHAGQHALANLVPTPQNGLYTPDDLAQARRQALLNLGAGMAGSPAGRTAGLAGGIANGLQAAQAGGQTALQQILEQRMQGLQVGQYQRIMQTRQQVQQQYAPSPTDSPADLLRKYELATQTLAMANDPEGAKSMSDAGAAVAKAHHITPQDLGNRVSFVDDVTGKEVGSAPKLAPPATASSSEITPGSGYIIRDSNGNILKYIPPAGEDPHITLEREQNNAGNLLKLNGQFNQDTTPYQTREQAYSMFKGAVQNGTDYKAMLLNYARLANPNRAPGPVTVDELAQLGDVGTQLYNRAHQIVKGSMSPEGLRLLDSSADQIMQGAAQDFDSRRVNYQNLGAQMGLDPYKVNKSLMTRKVKMPGETTVPGETPAAAAGTAVVPTTPGGNKPGNPYAPKGQ
jgi:hypothetical protein